MNKEEKDCRDLADVCELAHKRTVEECKGLGIAVDCTSSMFCGDNQRDHDEADHYTTDAQEIFDRHYEYITSVTGI